MRLIAALLALALAPEAWAQSRSTVGFSCRRLTGIAIGVVHAPGTWDRLGRSPTFPSFSPVLGGACVLSMGPITWSLGTDAQFTYVHYDTDKNLTHGWLTAFSQVMAGSEEWRAGVHGVGVFEPVGAGISVDWLPGNPRGARDGVEARLTWYWPEQPNLQLMLLYVVTTPRIP